MELRGENDKVRAKGANGGNLLSKLREIFSLKALLVMV